MARDGRMNASTERLQARVRGRVQGVGFRYFAQREAVRLGLSGWVRNERDGSVLVVAEGPRPTLEKLLSALATGPATSSVANVDASWASTEGEGPGFRVRYS